MKRIGTTLALLALLAAAPAGAESRTLDRIACVVDDQVITLSEVEEREGRPVRKGTGEPLTAVMTAMSKSKGNVVNPDDVIAEYGADTFRLYEMFMSPLGDARTWDPKGVVGCRRFLERAWRLFVDEEAQEALRPSLDGPGEAADVEAIERALNRMLKRIDDSFGPLDWSLSPDVSSGGVIEGVWMKPLRLGERHHNLLLIYFEPGALYPAHVHTEPEQLLILEGAAEDRIFERGGTLSEVVYRRGAFVDYPVPLFHATRCPRGCLLAFGM